MLQMLHRGIWLGSLPSYTPHLRIINTMRRALLPAIRVPFGRQFGAEVSVSAGTSAAPQPVAVRTVGRFQRYANQHGRGIAVYISLTGELATVAVCYVLHKRLVVDGDVVTAMQAVSAGTGDLLGYGEPLLDFEYYGNKQLSIFGFEFYARLIPNYFASTMVVPMLAFVHVPFCVVTGRLFR